ncbi:hypothetical protein [Alteromonas sp. a30]|uniref:hypothetical protein n=1 Tax=Alteromonas sp. a30 TaxID=2730917 RepID=UPI002281CD86|nr:hypothetical protein [Alteromonas sp. a30]MCY7294101.1 hypothetical protein [Alteromonas sp. a30]
MLDQPTLKEISNLKKKINWGELPPFFHMVSNSLADLEGIHAHGFDHALKRLIDRNNWNLERLEGHYNERREVVVKRKPEVILFSHFNKSDYEIGCAPMSQGGPVMVFTKGDPFIDFKVWEPATMSSIVRLPRFAEFIVYAYQKGDEADRMLINFAAQTIDNLLKILSDEVNIIEFKGQSILDLVKDIESQFNVNHRQTTKP